MSVLSIREITKEDIPVFAPLISTAFAPVSDLYGFRQDVDLSPLVARLEEGFLQESRQFGAWLGDEPVGFFALDPKDEEVFEISRFCIHPSCQRQGYGQALLDRAIAEIRRANGVAAVCAVIGDNSPLLGWLKRNRFTLEVSGTAPGMPCSICILQKDLPPEPGCSAGSCAGCSGGCG